MATAVAGQLRFPIEGRSWTVAKDGDPACLALFKRHYSHKPYRDGRQPKLFVGPGSKLVLVSPTLDALFVWRKFRDDSRQRGINCSVFRNEGPLLSSLLILEAEALAWARWTRAKRLYTYINPNKTRRKRDPGRCFRKAGWKPCGVTKNNHLVILKKLKGWAA